MFCGSYDPSGARGGPQNQVTLNFLSPDSHGPTEAFDTSTSDTWSMQPISPRSPLRLRNAGPTMECSTPRAGHPVDGAPDSTTSADGASPAGLVGGAHRADTPFCPGRRRNRRDSCVVNLGFGREENSWRSEDVLSRRVARCTIEPPDAKKQRR